MSCETEFSYRTGGDQFALLQSQARKTEELCSAFSLACERNLGFSVTLSGGGVLLKTDYVLPVPESVHAIHAAAADVLALAKHDGRNTVLWLSSADAQPDPYTADAARQLYLNLAKVNAAQARTMEVESRIDALTGLYNRRGFDDIFGRLAESSARNRKPLGLIYLDSDSLKGINDAEGHEAGDRFIVDLSMVLRSVVRRSDFVFRWGSDEFAVILEPTEVSKAFILAERIRTEVAARTQGTVSVGVYHGIPKDAAAAVRAADEAMYAAKREGKNKVKSIEQDMRS